MRHLIQLRCSLAGFALAAAVLGRGAGPGRAVRSAGRQRYHPLRRAGRGGGGHRDGPAALWQHRRG